MNNFINILNSLGISVSLHSSPILLFLYLIVFFAILGLLSIINVIVYLGVLYLGNSRLFLNKLKKWPFLLKLFNIYKRTSIYFIISELCFFLFCQCSIIWFCLKFINGIS
jgi:hypothetical protein